MYALAVESTFRLVGIAVFPFATHKVKEYLPLVAPGHLHFPLCVGAGIRRHPAASDLVLPPVFRLQMNASAIISRVI